MSVDLHIERRAFADRIAGLGFGAPIPRDWIVHPLPDDPPDFSNPTELVPLAMVTAPHSAIVLAFMARPAFDDGTVHDWAMYLLAAHGMRPRAISVGTVGTLPAIVGEAEQDSEVGTIVVRFAFCEDGGRLINISLAAPEMLASTVTSFWFQVAREFTLDTPRGATVGVRPGEAPGVIPGGGLDAMPGAAAAATPGADDADASSDQTITTHDQPADSAGPVPLTGFAVATDHASLDPGHPINVNLRDRGIGLVPNVVAVDDDRSVATIAAGSIVALVDVPFGWHAIDDGRRLLVFDPASDVQISFNLLAHGGRSMDGVLDAIEGEARSDYADPHFIRVASGHIQGLGIRNISDGDQPLEQYHLLLPGPETEWLLRARVTAPPDHGGGAANLGEAMLLSIRFAAADQAGPGDAGPGDAPAERSDQPEWWQRAVALEREGRLDDAENVIVEAVNHLGAYASVARLFAERMVRLQEAGDSAGAHDAFRRSRGAISYYASLATSGGEGLALSADRDRFIAELEQSYSGDPDIP